MDEITERLQYLTTPHIADACLRVGERVRCAPAELSAISENVSFSGRVLPARHFGSVDVFLEALEHASSGDVLVADSSARMDEACIGDLIALEVASAGCSGIVVDGLHRDSEEIRGLGLPVVSRGTLPTGPQRLEPRSSDALEWARCGQWLLTKKDFAIGDCDGIVFLSEESLPTVVKTAEEIRETERAQANKMRAGESLREQTQFREFMKQRSQDPNFGFRQHLRYIGRAIEE